WKSFDDKTIVWTPPLWSLAGGRAAGSHDRGSAHPCHKGKRTHGRPCRNRSSSGGVAVFPPVGPLHRGPSGREDRSEAVDRVADVEGLGAVHGSARGAGHQEAPAG